MEIEILNSSIVVTAQSHNPSILHPSFLADHVVPRRWEPAEPPLCTPAMSTVKYRSGVVFSVDLNRLQILQNQPPLDPSGDPIPVLAMKYVRTLPHVKYKEVGINATGFIDFDGASQFLIEHFIKGGPWNDSTLVLRSAGVRLTYQAEGADQVLFSIEPGTVTSISAAEERNGIALAANYHYNLRSAAADAVSEAVAHYADCINHFRRTVRTIFSKAEVSA
jgi:hypothetical protein